MTVVTYDISESLLVSASKSLMAAVDIETTGLDWATESIASVQVALPDGRVEIVRVGSTGRPPRRLIQLLESSDILKVFHHAMFDLRFMRTTWDARAARVACTKVASKVVDPGGEIGHRLVDLTYHYLDTEIDKGQQASDWLAHELSPDQISYAANDVLHLMPLLHALLGDLRARDLESIALRCFDHIPVRVELEVRGLGDVFTY